MQPAAIAQLDVPRGAVIGHKISELLQADGQMNLLDALISLANAHSGNTLTVTTRRGQDLEYQADDFPRDGEQMLLCQMTDGTAGSTRADALEEHLSDLFARGADGIVFINKSGAC